MAQGFKSGSESAGHVGRAHEARQALELCLILLKCPGQVIVDNHGNINVRLSPHDAEELVDRMADVITGT